MWKKYIYFIRRAHWRFWEDVLVASYLCYISDIFIQVQLFKAAFQRGRNSHCGAQRRRLQGEGVKTLPVQSDISADMSISPSFVLACCCPAMLITLLKADCASHLVQWQKPISTKTEADFFYPFASYVFQRFLAQPPLFFVSSPLSKTKRRTTWAVQH